MGEKVASVPARPSVGEGHLNVSGVGWQQPAATMTDKRWAVNENPTAAGGPPFPFSVHRSSLID
jgi:hypothetical protein